MFQEEARELGKRKRPHIPEWKVWLMVVLILQVIGVIQSCWRQSQNLQSHQLLWDSVIQQGQALNEHVEGANQYLVEMNQVLEAVGGEL